MSNFYYDLDIESVLQCPVCYELPPRDIFLCKVGHHMCDRCKKRLQSCPTCQAALTGSRNFLAEALITKFSVFKGGEAQTNNNQSNGPFGDAPMTHIQTNNNELKTLPTCPGVFRCMLEACRYRKGMGASKLVAHVEATHAPLFEKFKNKSATFTHNFKNFCFMKKKHKFHRAFHISNMGLFFLNLKIVDGSYINCWISTPAPVKHANKFDYEIEYSKEDDNRTILFTSKVASNLMDSPWLLKRAHVFVIRPRSHGLEDNQFFSLLVKIIFKPPEVNVV